MESRRSQNSTTNKLPDIPIRSGWYELHQYVKPAVDADSLSIPFPLLNALRNKVSQLPGFERVQFVFYHLPEVQYLEARGHISGITSKLARVIPNAQPFPAKLGLIGLPYSQRFSLFLNTLLTHEIGHFVYQETQQEVEIARFVVAELQAAGTAPPAGRPQDFTWSADRMKSWAEEVFCDLFAVRIAGPAYSLAFIELLDLARSGYPDPSGRFSTDKEHAFYDSHPAHAFRLARQVELLERLGWWPQVRSFKTHYIDVLQRAAETQESQYVYGPSAQDATMCAAALAAFLKMAPKITERIEKIANSLDAGANEFSETHALIAEYLHRGIVPSTLVDNGRFIYPGPFAVLNAAYKVSLESIDQLIAKVEPEERTAAARSSWQRRLELWALKAFEDHERITLSQVA